MGLLDSLFGGDDENRRVQPGMQLGDVGPDGRGVPVQQVGDRTYSPEVMRMAQAYNAHPDLVEFAQKERQQQMLGSIGATLLAAGQAGPVGQRGQILSKMDLSGGQPMTTSLLNSQQMQLYAEQVKEKQQARKDQDAFNEMLKKQAGGGGVGTAVEGGKASPVLTPQQAAALAALPAHQRVAAYQQFVQDNLKAPEWTAPVKDADGNLTITNLKTRETKILGKPTTNITMTAEGEEQKTLGKASGEEQVALAKRASSSPLTVAKLNLLENTLDNIKTGRFADSKGNLVASMRGFGFDDDSIKKISGLDPTLPGSQQAAEKIINEMTVGLIGQGQFPANNFSDADRNFLTKILPSITNEPGANKIAIEIQRRISQRDAEAHGDWLDAKDKGVKFDAWQRDYNRRQNAAEKDGKGLFADLQDKLSGGANGRIGAPAAAAPAGMPPNARKAADGHFYVPDPSRPGKYLMVQ